MSITPKNYKRTMFGFLLLGFATGFEFIAYDDWSRIRDNIIIFYAILMAAIFVRSMRKFPLDEPAYFSRRQIDDLARQYYMCLNLIHASFSAAIAVVILLLFGDQLLRVYGEITPIGNQWLKRILSALTGAFAFAPLASLNFAYRFERNLNVLEVAVLHHKRELLGDGRTGFRDRFERRAVNGSADGCRMRSKRRLSRRLTR